MYVKFVLLSILHMENCILTLELINAIETVSMPPDYSGFDVQNMEYV